MSTTTFPTIEKMSALGLVGYMGTNPLEVLDGYRRHGDAYVLDVLNQGGVPPDTHFECETCGFYSLTHTCACVRDKGHCFTKMEKFIEEAKRVNDSGSIQWTTTLDQVATLVSEMKKACPAVKHATSVDWDNETLYRSRFTWEPGSFGVPPPPLASSAPTISLTPQKPPLSRTRTSVRW